jgi:hypothetical protein
VDPLEQFRHRLGGPDNQHRLERREDEDRRNQHRLEEVESVSLITPLELQGREASGGQQHHEGEDRRPRRVGGHGARLGEQTAGEAGGRQRRSEQQHGYGKGVV